jgi:hypothetical protein
MLGRKPNGRPDRPKVIGNTRAAVLKQMAELRRKADEGTVIGAGQRSSWPFLGATFRAIHPTMWTRQQRQSAMCDPQSLPS